MRAPAVETLEDKIAQAWQRLNSLLDGVEANTAIKSQELLSKGKGVDLFRYLDELSQDDSPSFLDRAGDELGFRDPKCVQLAQILYRPVVEAIKQFRLSAARARTLLSFEVVQTGEYLLKLEQAHINLTDSAAIFDGEFDEYTSGMADQDLKLMQTVAESLLPLAKEPEVETGNLTLEERYVLEGWEAMGVSRREFMTANSAPPPPPAHSGVFRPPLEFIRPGSDMDPFWNPDSSR